MRRLAVLSLLAGLALASTTASATKPVVKYSTMGGFTLFNFSVEIYADGSVKATRVNHRANVGTLQFDGYVTPATLNAIVAALNVAQVTTAPGTVGTGHMIPDLPSQTIVYGGKTVTLSPMGNGAPASVRLLTAFHKLGAVFGQVYEQPYLVYQTSGGWGASDHLTVSRGGHAVFERGGRAPVAKKDLQIPSDVMASLVAAVNRSGWGTLKDRYSSIRPVMDGVNVATTLYSVNGHSKTVRSQTAAHPPAGYSAVATAIGKVKDVFLTQTPQPR